jgi:chromosome partitioning protein
VNQKGGVGKSTTAVSLGAALAELGFGVLVMDLDPQGNASTGMGIRHIIREVTTYEVLLAEAPIEDAIVDTPLEGLSAVPATIDLAGAEIELVSQFSREMRLRKALDPVRAGRFDFILLDCPPSLGLLTVNALAAADELIVPIQCEYYALEGLGQLLRNVRMVQQNVNQKLRLSGIVLTMFDARTKLSEQVVAEVKKYFGSRVYDTIIPRTVRLSEAPGFGQPITVYDPTSKGAVTYRSLAKEVAEREVPGEPLPMVGDIPPVMVARPEDRQTRPPTPPRKEPREPTEAAAPESEPVQAAAEPPPAPSGDSAARRPTAEARGAEATTSGGSPEPAAQEGAPATDTGQGPIRRVEIAPRHRDERRAPEPAPVEGQVAEEQAPVEVDAGLADLFREPTVVSIRSNERDTRQGPTPPESDEAQEERPPRRRWRLFRKGGDQ